MYLCCQWSVVIEIVCVFQTENGDQGCQQRSQGRLQTDDGQAGQPQWRTGGKVDTDISYKRKNQYIKISGMKHLYSVSFIEKKFDFVFKTAIALSITVLILQM
jgi:hypothetical protein